MCKWIMDIIIPCAGLSSRFPDMKPKYLLKDKFGKLMLDLSLGNFLSVGQVHLGILVDHEKKYNVANFISEYFGYSFNFVFIEKVTRGPADTVRLILDSSEIDGGFFIKDCDSSFDMDLVRENSVAISYLSDNNITNPEELGYVLLNNKNYVLNLVEKQMVSNCFCVGGYNFYNKDVFYKGFYNISNQNTELYFSQLINSLTGTIDFKGVPVLNYKNYGTLIEWEKYNKNL